MELLAIPDEADRVTANTLCKRGNTLHIHRVPTEVTHREGGRVRWCFGCRRRLAGTYRLHVSSDPMSYYEPNWSYRCDGCGEDHRLGFGWEWLDGAPGPDALDRAAGVSGAD